MQDKFFFTLIMCFMLSLTANAQDMFTLSGYVLAEGSNEALFNADISVVGKAAMGTTSNEYGFFSLTMPAGKYTIAVNYLGYARKVEQIKLVKDLQMNFLLKKGIRMEEVIISNKRADENVTGTVMGKVNLKAEAIKELPALFGEVDVLKTLQLLPGVLTSGEGSSGFYVRGGGADQNLILMDEALVYNSGHLLGFFSVFNPDAVKNLTLIKGSMPARYGGRLSSVVDIQMKEGNSHEFGAAGGIGLVSSRLMLEGPILKDKAAFLIAGRRTYLMDLVQPFLKKTNFAGTNYFFYDINAKLNYRFSGKNRLYASAYFGRDVFKFQSKDNGVGFDFPYGNKTLSVRWNHLFSDKLFMNLTAVYNDYMYNFTGSLNEFTVKSTSRVRDIGLKARWEYFPAAAHDLTFGLDLLHNTLSPNIVSGETELETFQNDLLTKYGGSIAGYIMDDWKINARLKVLIGLRLSLFAQLGPFTSSTEDYSFYEPLITYFHPQPRASMRYKLTSNSSIKAGIGYTVQYLHRVSNSSSTLPIDIWVPSTRRIKPQENIQYSVGYFLNFASDTYAFSTQLYYRDLYNQIDYRDDYVSSITSDIETQFVIGRGRAYGAEVYLKKQKGKLTGWISYTLSRSQRSFPDIEEGRIFPATYDKTHDLSVVATYRFSPKFLASATFVYGSGKGYTPIAGIYPIESNLHIFYGPRNSKRLEDYHRLDLSFTYTPLGGENKSWKSSWNLSIYNVYNRKNPFFIYNSIETDDASGTVSNTSTKVSIFPIIPSISWSFKWNQE